MFVPFLYQWQLISTRREEGFDPESDAPRIMEAIPFWASEQVADHAPVDTDILLINRNAWEKTAGAVGVYVLATNPPRLVKANYQYSQARSADAARIRSVRRVVELCQEGDVFVETQGDMIDGYIIKLCQSSYKHAIRAGVLLDVSRGHVLRTIRRAFPETDGV